MKIGIGLVGGATALVCLTGPAYAQVDFGDRLADVEERLEQIEKKTILDRIYLSGEYRTIYNGYIYDDGSGDDEVTEELWSHRLRVQLRAEPVSSVRITARLVMFKHFGDNDEPAFVADFERSRLPRDTVARFDQAWIDWFVTDWMAISAGRVAYAGGPPADLMNNKATRQATWGTPIVDGEYDTINVTFRIPGTEFYIRGFYSSYFFDNPNDELPFLNDGTDALRVVGGNIDFSLPSLGRNLFQFTYLIIPRWTLFPANIDDPNYDPEADFRNAPGALSTRNIFPSQVPDSFGTWQTINGTVVFYDLLDSGFDVFLSGSLGFIDSSNEGVEYEISLLEGQPRESTPLLFFPSTEEDGQALTTFLYTGFRYTIPVDALNRPKVGFEFNMGSRYMISLAQNTDRLLAKLQTRGYAAETYLIVPINDSLFLRAGYLFVQTDHPYAFAGPNPAIPGLGGSTSPAVDQQIHNFHFTLDASI